MPLTEPQKKYLRRLGHDREPIVLVGQNGISPNLAELAASTRSELVQRIGHVALYYRRNPDQPGILLPD